MGEIVKGRIIQHDEHGVLISAPCPSIERAALRQYDTVWIEYEDGRTLSNKQRNKTYALLSEIAEWQGDTVDAIKRIAKIDFMVDNMQSICRKIFSLSDIDMTTAREFITYLVDFVLRWGVPTKVPLYELCDDIERYVYACLIHKKCAVCGAAKADLHHWDALGIGRDRTETPQLGWPVISLCRAHHQEAHSQGRSWLTDTMHLVPVPLDAEIGKAYKLTKKALRAAQ